MRKSCFLVAGLAVSGLLAGCYTPPPGVETGPHHTIAYDVTIEASQPGARIEAEGTDLGNAPVHLKIFGDQDGTFHDFGSYTYTIRAYPLATNQFPQVRVFGTGKGFLREDRIPQKIYFDMNQPAAPPPAAVYGPEYGYPDYYYGPPPPYYYGPRVRVYYGPRYRYYHRR